MTVTKSTSNMNSPAYVAVPKDQVEPFLAENKGRTNEWWKARPKIFLVLVTLAFAMDVFHLFSNVGVRKYKVTKAASDEIEVVMPWNGRPDQVFHHGEKDVKASSSSSSDDEKEGWFADWEWPWESSDSSSSDSSSNDSSSSDSSSSDSSSADSSSGDSSSADSSSSDSSSSDSSSSDETSPNTVNVEPVD
jgi:hypothetical protein